MQKKNLIVVVLALIIAFGFSGYARAADNVGVRINGELKDFKPSAEIKNERTMVPVRFVIESLGGEVFWDGKQQKIAMNCRGKYIEFFVGSKKANIDGQSRYFDSPPYISQNRTFIPLRFLVENLGAKVLWNASGREVNIDFAQEPLPEPGQQEQEVFAYYYYKAGNEMKQNIDLFTHIAFRWFAANAQGELYYEYQDDYQGLLKLARDNGVKAHASIVLMGKDSLHSLLTSPQNRARLIGNILDKVKQDGYDGVDIDFEFIAPADGPYFTLFLKELKTALGPDIPLSTAVFARTGNENWATPYEYKKIGQIVDRVVVMAYDYSYATSKPGPIAPLWWVRQVAAYMTANIPAEKVLLGIPTYGYDWPSGGGKAKTVTASRLASLQQSYSLQGYFDTRSMSPYYTYYDENGNFHQIWMENKKSLAPKLETAREYNFAGISFWQIGNGFDDLYQLLKEK